MMRRIMGGPFGWDEMRSCGHGQTAGRIVPGPLITRTKSAREKPSILGGADERDDQQDHHDENQGAPERRAVRMMVKIAAESVSEHGGWGLTDVAHDYRRRGEDHKPAPRLFLSASSPRRRHSCRRDCPNGRRSRRPRDGERRTNGLRSKHSALPARPNGPGPRNNPAQGRRRPLPRAPAAARRRRRRLALDTRHSQPGAGRRGRARTSG